MRIGCVLIGVLLLVGCPDSRSGGMRVSPSGHYVQYKGRTLMLVGDSGTQCVTQNANLDYRSWIDDCAERGIRLVHVWSFIAPRQKQDGSEIEERWGYVFPGLTPWARNTSGALANDQLCRWNLRVFDEGPDGDATHYWPRLRDLCAYAKSKNTLVGYTLFTGWLKGNSNVWPYHPFNVQNGGHLSRNLPDGVTIESPGAEVWQETWSDSWPNPKKTQWIWEQLSIKAIHDLAPFGNVFFVCFDEHSYPEGNMGDHFLQFFKKRNAIWVDWDARRSGVDFVFSDTFTHEDKNALAVAGFLSQPARPYLLLEGEPYQGDAVRTSMWTFALGGGHYTFHGDAEQETPQTGIMGYDPRVPGGDMGMVKRDWLGHLSRFFNNCVHDLDQMIPHNELVSAGAYCLAHLEVEYVVYSKIGAPETFHVDLRDASAKKLRGRFYDPRNGRASDPFPIDGGTMTTFTKPDSQDYVLHLITDLEGTR